MTAHPFPGLAARRLRGLLAVCSVAFLASGALMVALSGPLEDRGSGIIDLELADGATSASILEDWGSQYCAFAGHNCQTPDVVWRAKAVVLTDFVFLVAYGLGGAAILALLADRRRDRPISAHRLSLAAWAVLAAAVLDAAENAMLWQVLVLHTRGFAEAATVLAVGKFSLLAIVALATPVILIMGGRRTVGVVSSAVEDRPPAPRR